MFMRVHLDDSWIEEDLVDQKQVENNCGDNGERERENKSRIYSDAKIVAIHKMQILMMVVSQLIKIFSIIKAQ